jgi:galactonate dehydratase
MKITDLVTIPITCHGDNKRGIVKITTDEGFTGYGEIGEAATGQLGKIITERWRRFVIDKDPLDVERILREIWAANIFAGRMGGAVLNSYSGVDFSLLDLKGKILGIPCFQVVGGGYRQRIRIYQDTAGGPDSETYAQNALVAKRKGFDAIKFDLDVGYGERRAEQGYEPYNETVTEAELVFMIDKVKTIREAIGYDTDLAIDLHGRYNTMSGIKIANALEPFKLLWLEEPVQAENIDAMYLVRMSTKTPICCGENLYTKWGFKDLLEKQAADIIMPDIAQCGGIIEGKRISDLADMYYVPVAPHNNCGPFATIAMAHMCASIPNFLVLEWHGARMKDWETVVNWDGPIIDKGGINLLNKPGMGYRLNEKEILKRNPEAEELFR